MELNLLHNTYLTSDVVNSPSTYFPCTILITDDRENNNTSMYRFIMSLVGLSSMLDFHSLV